ncbi:uncharacterized protein RSE6_11463 [Rhynchosporium secalis]|uniref:SnoaL-like domain-containing protein n=1 Tax=Rhynchosporium secalis TaxID=38038 RepID=A0A1E1MN07_RHYSE|nr:uncharacterized protein RSE6_11463 [Rhynchosporium secalis]
MRFTSILSLCALLVAPLGTLSAPTVAVAPEAERADNLPVTQHTPQDASQSGALVASGHALEKRIPFVVSKAARIKLVIAATAVAHVINWAMVFNMIEDSEGYVDVNAYILDKYSTPGAKIEAQWKDNLNTPTESFQRPITFDFKGFLGGQEVICELTALMEGSAERSRVVQMLHQPTLKIGGIIHKVTSWHFKDMDRP